MTTELNIDRHLATNQTQTGKALQNLEDHMTSRSSDLTLDSTSPPTATAGAGFVAGSGNEGLVTQLAVAAMAVRVQTGGYCYNHLGKRVIIPTSTSLAVAASDPTNGRKDIVVLTAAGKLAVRTGTPNASPVDPTLTAGDVPLARLTVDALATTIVTAKIADLRNRKSISVSKIPAGGIGLGKLDPSTSKSGSFTGAAAAGAITLTGAAVGDRVLAVFEIDTSSGVVTDKALFESTITVINQIQQVSAANLSAKKYGVILIPAAS
jgi:hypothetical protein